MKRRSILLIMLFVATLASALCYIYCGANDKPYTIKKGMIHFDEPKREAGQTSMLGFAAEPIDTVRVGIIGLGMRGKGPLKRMSFID